MRKTVEYILGILVIINTGYMINTGISIQREMAIPIVLPVNYNKHSTVTGQFIAPTTNEWTVAIRVDRLDATNTDYSAFMDAAKRQTNWSLKNIQGVEVPHIDHYFHSSNTDKYFMISIGKCEVIRGNRYDLSASCSSSAVPLDEKHPKLCVYVPVQDSKGEIATFQYHLLFTIVLVLAFGISHFARRTEP